MRKENLRQKKITKAIARRKDYEKKRNILSTWVGFAQNLVKMGVPTSTIHPPVTFPKRKKYAKKVMTGLQDIYN